jgi:hypothetical protein
MREPTEELGHCRQSISLPTSAHTSFRSPIGDGRACRLRPVATLGRGGNERLVASLLRGDLG